jgi:hypothetical protein
MNKNYVEGIPRISNIVSFAYPFDGNSKMRYLNWLNEKWIKEEEYLAWANEFWSIVHKWIEDFINWNEIIKTKETESYINHWIEYIKQEWLTNIKTEVFLKEKNNLIQWTADIIFNIWKDIYIGDWKSYWGIKSRYGLSNKFAVDIDKRKKVQLQLSLYVYIYNQYNKKKIKWIKLLFLHNDWLKVYDMDILPNDDIEKIIKDYYNSLSFITF